MIKTVHYYKVYTNNFGSPDKFVQLIKLFRLNDNTIRVKSDNGKISDIPANRFRIAKDTDALYYVPKRNHVGYILEEVKLNHD